MLVLAAMAAVFLLLSFGPQKFRADPGDAMVYWVAAEELRQGNDIYEHPGWETFHRPYIYPPPAAALFAPFTLLDDRPQMDSRDRGLMRPYPYPTVMRFWTLLHGLAWALAVFMLARAMAATRRERARVAALATIATGGLLWLDAWYGNINVFILLLLVIGIADVLKGRQWRGGMVLGAAAMIKVMPVVLLPIFLLQRRWKAGAAMFAGAALMWLAPLVFLVPELGLLDGIAQNFTLSWRFLEKLVLPSLGSGAYQQSQPYLMVNTSPMAALQRLFGEGTALFPYFWDADSVGPMLFALPQSVVKAAGMLLPLAMYVMAARVAMKRRDDRTQWGMLGLAFVAASALNVLFWHYHMVMLMIPAAVAAVYVRKHRPMITAIMAAWVPLLAAPHVVAHWGHEYRFVQWMMAWGVPTLGFLVGWFVAWHLIRREAAVELQAVAAPETPCPT